MIAFAVAIPLLAALVMINQQETFRGRLSSSGFLNLARAIAMLASGTGIVAAFWNMSSVAGVVVICSMVIAVGAHSPGYVRLELPLLRRLSRGAEAAAEAKAAAAKAAAEATAGQARAAADAPTETVEPVGGRKPLTFLNPSESLGDAIPAAALERLRRIKLEQDPAGRFRSNFGALGNG